MPGIGVISNPNARLNRLSPKIKDRLTFVVGRGGEVASTGTLDDAESAAEMFRDSEIDIVAISGGDGTAHRTLEVLLEAYGDVPLPPILLLPSGTMNMVPASFGIHMSSFNTMLLTLARYRHNLPLTCIRRNLLRVNDRHSFLFSLGVAPRFLEKYYACGHVNAYGATKLVSRLAVGAFRGDEETTEMVRPLQMTYRLDDGPVQQAEGHSIFCSFIEQVSLRFRPFPRAGWDRNVFEILRVGGAPGLVAKALPAIWIGSLKPHEGFERDMARSMELTIDTPEAYTLDGEVYEPEREFHISAGPELRFVVPRLLPLRPELRRRSEEIGPWELRYFV